MATYDDMRGACLDYLRDVERLDRGPTEHTYKELAQQSIPEERYQELVDFMRDCIRRGHWAMPWEPGPYPYSDGDPPDIRIEMGYKLPWPHTVYGAGYWESEVVWTCRGDVIDRSQAEGFYKDRGLPVPVKPDWKGDGQRAVDMRLYIPIPDPDLSGDWCMMGNGQMTIEEAHEVWNKLGLVWRGDDWTPPEGWR